MSFKAFVWAWDQDVPNGDFHHVLCCLANIAPIREVKASIFYIADQVHRSPRKVRSAIEWLSEAGIITVTPRPGKTDIIRLNIPKDFVVVMDDDGEMERGVRGRPKKNPPHLDEKTPAPLGLKPLQNPCTPCADEPIEPRLEPKMEAKASLSPAEQVFRSYNRIAERNGFHMASVFSDARRKAILARIKDAGGLQVVLNAIESMETSAFLTGKTGSTWKPRLDFFLQSSSFAKLVDGFYHEERHGKATGEFAGFDFGNGNFDGQYRSNGMAYRAVGSGGRRSGLDALVDHVARSYSEDEDGDAFSI